MSGDPFAANFLLRLFVVEYNYSKATMICEKMNYSRLDFEGILLKFFSINIILIKVLNQKFRQS